jgi:AAA+ ATPase superfamily predicted ATPase
MIGRKKEKELLADIVQETSSNLVAIYGRRRVGKTYLIREYFLNKFTFYHTGIANVSTEIQLDNFYTSLSKYSTSSLRYPTNWFDAFEVLKQVITKSRTKKKVVFLDELPWLDTAKSNFLPAFEHFWNSWGSSQQHLTFIICGSSTSYIVRNIFNHKGGLHNRINYKIKLQPFTLSEVEEFLQSKNIKYNRYQIVKLYMCIGGIPYYLQSMKKGKGVEQNIDALLFDQNGLLKNEFENLYASLFLHADKYIEIIKTIATKRKGLTREEIAAKVSTKNGGTLTKILQDLELSDFIIKYQPFGKKERNSLYQLTDFFSLFYLSFINKKNVGKDDWIQQLDTPSYRAWAGYSFEALCLLHLNKINQALGIAGLHRTASSWVSTSSNEKVQIDLILDRRDDIINLFEMKYSIAEYEITRKYDAITRQKIATFQKETKTKKTIHLVYISTYGLKQNSYSYLAQNSLTMNDLF